MSSPLSFMAASPSPIAAAAVGTTATALSSVSHISPNYRAAAAAGPTDERALLMLLQDEVKRLQAQKSEKNNETRTLLEMKVAIEQLEAVTEQRRRLAEDVAKERANAARLTQRIAELEADAQLKSEQRKVAEHHSSTEISELKSQLDKLTVKESDAQTRLAALEKELSLTKDRAVSAKKDYTATEQVNFEQMTILKTKLTQALIEIDSLKEQSLYDAGQAKEREYDLSQAVAAANRERQSVSHDLAAERRAHIQDVAELKRALHEVHQSNSSLQATYDASSRMDHEKLVRLTSEMQLLKEKANSDAEAAKAREKALDEQNMKLISDLRVAQAEINSMTSQEWTDKKALTQRLIEITVARDAALQSATELREKMSLAQQDHTVTVAQLQNQLAQANARLENFQTSHSRDTQDDRRRIVELEQKLRLAESDYEKLRNDMQRQSDQWQRQLAVRESELNSCRVELRATVETLHRLEQQVQDNVQVKLLTDENSSLREQCEALKKRVVEMTSNLTHMKAVADTAEGARVSSFQGLVADYHRRIVALEKEQRFSRPLIKDLAALCRKHSLLDAVLDRDLELYNSSFAT